MGVLVSRTPHGVRGLKLCHVVGALEHDTSRTPHGVRGLKCIDTLLSVLM